MGKHNGPHEETHKGSATETDGKDLVIYETSLCWCGAEISRRQVNRIKGGA